MAEAVHLIDPSADTIIVLKYPSAPFAVWSDNWGYNPWKQYWSLRSFGAKTEKKKGKKGRIRASGWEEPPLASDPMEGPSVTRESLFGGEQTNIPEVSSNSQFGVEAPQLDEPVEEGKGSIHYHVSSRHLALASGFFKSSLAKDGWVEGQPNAADGMYHLSAADWDPEAFLILLQVLHLRNRLIPRSLTLEMLAKMAVLVDYYRCSEAVEVFSEIWIDAAKQTSPIPSTYGRDLVLWMCIAWVFKQPAEFNQTTDIAVRQSKTATIQDMYLPIPKVALDEMEDKRYQTIKKLLSSLHGWLDEFRGDSYQCSRGSNYNFACSSMLLGALTKEMDRIGCLSPTPEAPFQQLSCEEIFSKVHEMTSPTWSDVSGGYHANRHPCNFHGTVKRDVDQIEDQLTGLDLSDFKDRSDGE